jgi:putative ABC transport system permease protein
MFDLDGWQEIFQSIGKNKLRTVLSGLTITFAIMLFTILLGMGNGLKNTFASFFSRDAENAIFIMPNNTSKAYRGYQSGRRIEFKNKDIDYILENYQGNIDHLIRRNQRQVDITYKNKKSNYALVAVDPEIQYLERSIPYEGRFINLSDLNKRSKVIVLGRMTKKDLFPVGVSAVGKYVNVGGLAYKVVGVFTDPGGDNEERLNYIPITTSQALYGNNDKVDQINILYSSNLNTAEAIAFGNNLLRDLKDRFDIAPRDQRGIRVLNRAEGVQATKQTSGALDMIVIIISIGTLIAGIVGISNIMIYIVKERTRELGIRKAIGATPNSIIKMIMFESLFITSIAGYLGMVIGIGVLAYAAPGLEKYFIRDPNVDSGIVIFATVLLVISGLIAGYVPARRAGKIKPIVALNDA